jgi:hypothetical protein
LKVEQALADISATAKNIRNHRHKRIGHFDRHVSLKEVELPKVTLAEIRTLIELIEKYLNLFFWEFEQTTMLFDMLSATDITGAAEISALKAQAYDILELAGTIPHNEWRKQRKA